jgi:spore maturation protein CgeB
VFSWDRYYIPQLKELGAPHVEYLPFAANPDIFKPIELNGEQREKFGCAVSFAGNSGAAEDNYRRSCVAALDGLDVRVYGDPGWADIQTKTIRYHGSLDNRTELPLLYNASAVNLNLTASQLRTALPIRVFDVAAAGALLISDYRVDLIDMFEDGREIICCRDMDQLRETVETWLAEPEKRAQIGRAARARIRQQHTFTHRIRKILDSIPIF